MAITEQRFHFITGKGGVGKTTISILLGVAFSQQQEKTLICEIDQREEISHYFKQGKSNGMIVQSAYYLSFVNIAFDQALEEYGLMKLKLKSIYQLFFDHPLAKALIALVPGVQDLVLLGKAFHHYREKNSKGESVWKKVILDAPATGHANTLLELPRVIKEAVPYGNLHQEAEQMWEMLASPFKNRIHLVCILEELAVQELIELQELLLSKGIHQSTIWINQYDPTIEWTIEALDFENEQTYSALSLKLMKIELLQKKKRVTQLIKLLQYVKDKPHHQLYYLPRFNGVSLAEFAKHAQAIDHYQINKAALDKALIFQQSIEKTLQKLNALINEPMRLSIPKRPQKPKVQKKLKLILGAGGVGKTTSAIALALQAQKQGLRVALLTIDPAKRLAQALGLSEIQGELSALADYPLIDAMMLDRKHSSDQLVRRCAQSPEQAEAILKNKYYQAFSSALAGTQEYMAIYEINQAFQKGIYDLIIVDTPPSQHAIDFLDTPQKLIHALNQKVIFQILSKNDRFSATNLILKSLGKLTAGPFLEELFQFISLFREVLDGLKNNALALLSLFEKNTEAILVSTAQEEPILLTMALKKQLEARAIPIQALLINRCQSALIQSISSSTIETELKEQAFWQNTLKNSLIEKQQAYALEQKQLKIVQEEFSHSKLITIPLKYEEQIDLSFEEELSSFVF